jgi:hypothetical protein
MYGGCGGHQDALGRASLRLGFQFLLAMLIHDMLAKITMSVI